MAEADTVVEVEVDSKESHHRMFLLSQPSFVLTEQKIIDNASIGLLQKV